MSQEEDSEPGAPPSDNKTTEEGNDSGYKFPEWKDICPLPRAETPELTQELKLRAAFHEAGHALVAEHLGLAVVRVSAGKNAITGRPHVAVEYDEKNENAQKSFLTTLAAGVQAELRTASHHPEVRSEDIARDAYISVSSDRGQLCKYLEQWNAAHPERPLGEHECFKAAEAVLNDEFTAWALPKLADKLLHLGQCVIDAQEWQRYYWHDLASAFVAERCRKDNST
jgi:hypothetical protein